MKLPTTDTRGSAADLARAAAIFLVVFAVYFIGYSRTLPPTADEMIDFGLAQSLAKWQIFSIDQVSTVGPNPEEFGLGGHRYSKYGPLQAVLSVPLFWLAQRLPIGAVDTVLLLNHLATALSMALLFLLVRRLGYGPRVGLAVVAVVAFGTPLWIHSKRYFAEPTITLCVIATVFSAYVAATTRRAGWLVLAGVAFGAAVAAKYVNAVLLAPVPIYLALSALRATARRNDGNADGSRGTGREPLTLPRLAGGEQRSGGSAASRGTVSVGTSRPEADGQSVLAGTWRPFQARSPSIRPAFTGAMGEAQPGQSARPVARDARPGRRLETGQLLAAGRALLWFAVGAAPVAALLALYDLARFGDPLASGYAHWESFSTPIWVGVLGFLFSPGKSIFVYTPLFVLLPFWGPGFVRRLPGFSALLGAVIALHLGLYGSWWVWWGAWAWGPRFIVPILPLVALFLSEGFAHLVRVPPLDSGRREPDNAPSFWERVRARARWLALPVVAILGLLSFAIQVLGISVDHTVYLVQLLPLNSKPDTLTLYDVRYQPILHQIPLLTRQWLDFAWIERTGPSVVNVPALAGALAGAVAAGIGFAVVWRSPRWIIRGSALVLAGLVVAGGTYQALRVYAGSIDPTTAAIVQAIAKAPDDTAILQMIPSGVVAYDNWQKRPLPEIGWIEEPRPGPIVVQRLQRFEESYPRLWVLTEAPPKAPSNGIEAMLDRSLVQVGDEPVGRFRLLRYVTRPTSLPFVGRTWHFADGIELDGFTIDGGPPTPGQRFDITLRWRAGEQVMTRPDYTVFVHLVSDDGRLIAQHDDPPASGYVPTSGWAPGQTVYDDHAITVPANAPAGLHLVQVGLYLPSTGKRVSLIGPDGKPNGDTATLDLARR